MSVGGAERVDALRSTAAHSVKWSLLQMVVATGGRLLFTLLFARLLGPDDFGIMAAATIYIALAMLLLNQGFGAALVQRQNLRSSDVRTVTTLNVVLAVAFVVLTMVLAPFVANFFQTPELTAVLRVLGLGLIVKGLTIVPLMLSRRDFRFRELAIIQSGAVLVGGLAGLVSIAAGAEYWALVVQTMTSDVVVLAALLPMAGLPRFGIDRQRLGGLFRFSSGLLGAQLLIFASQNSDNIIIGRVLGPTALAFYAVAYRLQRFPMQIVGSAVNDVALPIFSRLQDESKRLGNWFVKATRFVVLLAWPALVLMAVGADVAVPVLFGPKWEPAIRPLELLTLGALTLISRWLLAPLCTALGRTDLIFRWTVVHVTLLIAGYLVSVQWGINAVALCFGIVSVTVAIPQTLDVCRVLGLPWSRYISAHGPVAAGCAVLAVVWRSTAWGLDHMGASGAVILVVATIPALGAYLVVVRLAWPTVIAECRSIVNLSRSGKRPQAFGADSRLEVAG